MKQELFDELRQPIRTEIIKWFNEHKHDDGSPCRHCIWDRMWIRENDYQPIHKCLKSGKNTNEILGLGFDGKYIENFIKITNYSSELKDDLIFQFIEHPSEPITKKEADELNERTQNADADDYVCLHFDPRPNGEISISTEEK